MPLPNVYYGETDQQPADWREQQDKFNAIDDDAESLVTPHSVIDILGFDPLDMEGGDAVPSAECRARDEDRPEQKRMRVHGLEIIIEFSAGSTRSGKDWSVTLPYDYGYINGVMGADGDSLDVAMNPVTGEDGGWAYIFDQRQMKPKIGFDEHKVFLGYPNAAAALNAYKKGHSHWRDVLMDWTPMPVAEFKRWINDADLSKPCSAEGKV